MNEFQLVEQAHGSDGLGGATGQVADGEQTGFLSKRGWRHWIARTDYVCILGLSWIVDNFINIRAGFMGWHMLSQSQL